jgi:hypothetical protein
VKFKTVLLNATLLFSFFPYFRVIPGIDADVQPICGFIALILIVLFGLKRDKTTNVLLYLIAIIVFYSLTFAILEGNAIFVLSNFFSYLLPILTFLAIKDNTDLISERIVFWSLIVYLIVGLLQNFYMFGGVISLLKLDSIIRGIVDGPWGGNRGVTFLSPEPSYAVRAIIQIFVTILVLKEKNKISNKTFNFSIASFVIMLLINKSATGIITSIIIAIGFFFQDGKYFSSKIKSTFFTLVSTIALLSAPVILTIANNLSDKIRFFEVIKTVGDSDLWRNSPETIVTLIAGKRLITVYVGFMTPISNFGLGHGVGSYLKFDEFSKLLGIDFSTLSMLGDEERLSSLAPKPDSFASVLSMDTGFLGLAMLMLFLYHCYFENFRRKLASNGIRLGVFLAALYLILLNSPTSMPSTWILLAYVYSGFDKRIDCEVSNQ